MRSILRIYPNGDNKSSGVKTIDLTEDANISIVFTIVDFKDPEKKKTDWSKTIIVPATNANNAAFGHLLEVGVKGAQLGISRRLDCELMVEGLSVFRGIVRISKVDLNLQGGVSSYSFHLFGKLKDLFSEIGDKYMTDLTGLSSYDHTYNHANILSSWDGQCTNGPSFGFGSAIYLNSVTLTGVSGLTGMCQVNFTGSHGFIVGDTISINASGANWTNSNVVKQIPFSHSPGVVGISGSANSVLGFTQVINVINSTTVVVSVPYDNSYSAISSGSGVIAAKVTFTGNGYVYPYIDYGLTTFDNLDVSGAKKFVTWKTEAFKPAFFTKTLLDKIFSNAGYRYSSSFFESQYFKRTIVPFVNEKWGLTASEVRSREFLAGQPTVATYTSPASVATSVGYWNGSSASSGWVGSASNDGIAIIVQKTSKIRFGSAAGFPSSGMILGGGKGVDMSNWAPNRSVTVTELNNTAWLQFQDESSFPYFDGGNSFNPTLREFVAPDSGFYDLSFNGSFSFKVMDDRWQFHIQNVTIPPGTGPWETEALSRGASGTSVVYFDLKVNVALLETSSGSGSSYSSNGTVLAINKKQINGGVTEFISNNLESNITPLSVSASKVWLDAGNKVKVAYSAYLLTNIDAINLPVDSPAFHTIDIGWLSNMTFGAKVTEGFDSVSDGNTTNLTSSLPKNFKQKDFLLSLLRMFNLYITQDKLDPRLLIIEPRDNFYSKNEITDWTMKLDLSKTASLNMASELQYLRYLYAYKSDSDFDNDKYQKDFKGDVYGTRIKAIDNDYYKGDYKQSIEFSASPLVTEPNSSRVISRIVKSEDDGVTWKPSESNVRLLMYGGRGTQTNEPFNLVRPNFAQWFGSGSVFRCAVYPYAGHLDNPAMPIYDLNFGFPKETFFEYRFWTNNNLYNVFHNNFIEEMTSDSARVFSGYFNLLPSDISTLNPRSLFKVGQNLYRLSKLEFMPNSNASTKVEFIKVQNNVIL